MKNNSDEKETLEDALGSFIAPDYKSVPIFYTEDRYVLASAMQKAIRRGHYDIALSAALSLLKVDPFKCWNRLKVISIEDIGAANISLANGVFWAINHNQWRRESFSDEYVIAYLVYELCKSANSRFSNDLLCIANMHAGYKEKAGELNNLSNQDLEELYLDQKARIIERTLAGWYLSGVSLRNERNVVLRKGNVQRFIEIHRSGKYPDDVIALMRRSFSGGGGYGRTLALAWEHRSHATGIQYQNECDVLPDFIGNWPTEAYDIHTWIGKQAYQSILKYDNPIANFINSRLSHEKRVPALGMTVFALEGMLLKAREVYTGVPELLELAVKSYVSLHSLCGSTREDFFQIVQENFNLIHEARQSIIHLRMRELL